MDGYELSQRILDMWNKDVRREMKSGVLSYNDMPYINTYVDTQEGKGLLRVIGVSLDPERGIIIRTEKPRVMGYQD